MNSICRIRSRQSQLRVASYVRTARLEIYGVDNPREDEYPTSAVRIVTEVTHASSLGQRREIRNK